jgi:3-hydroxymyristoyl/3-hydroxydecanoyl-(acyl carrier protein) dehydratase
MSYKRKFTIKYNWWFVNEHKIQHPIHPYVLNTLDDFTTEQVFELIKLGHKEGELSMTIHEIDYRGYWELIEKKK